MIVDLARRYDYQPISTRVRIEPEQQQPESRIRQWIGMNAEEQVQRRLARPLRWAQGTHFESLGEDISDVNLLQSQRGEPVDEYGIFHGSASISNMGKRMSLTLSR